ARQNVTPVIRSLGHAPDHPAGAAPRRDGGNAMRTTLLLLAVTALSAGAPARTAPDKAARQRAAPADKRDRALRAGGARGRRPEPRYRRLGTSTSPSRTAPTPDAGGSLPRGPVPQVTSDSVTSGTRAVQDGSLRCWHELQDPSPLPLLRPSDRNLDAGTAGRR